MEAMKLAYMDWMVRHPGPQKALIRKRGNFWMVVANGKVHGCESFNAAREMFHELCRREQTRIYRRLFDE